MALSVSCSYLLIDVEELPLVGRSGLCKQVSKQSSSMVLFKSPASGSCIDSLPWLLSEIDWSNL